MKPSVLQAPNYQVLFESVPGLYLVLTKDLVIAAVSDAYLEATLSKREEICGRNIFEVFTDNVDDPAATGARNLRASLQRVLASRAGDAMPITKYDVLRPASEGGGFEARYWSPFNAPVLDADGNIVYIIHRVEDVTAFVRLKQQGSEQIKEGEALRTRTEKMETEVYLRAQEVDAANQRLHEANRELERLYEKTKELDRLKNIFFANISHELRTPLTLILGPVSKRLGINALEEDERRDLEIVQRNARLLLRQVNDLLDITSLDAGKMSIDYVRANVAHLVNLAASNFYGLAEDRDIRFSVHAPPELAAEIDSNKLTRILLNLLSNAFKFTPSGGSVALTLDASRDQVLVCVDDSGPGIPVAMRELVFERFRQLDGRRQSAEGTGLGLAIVRELVALHGGSICINDSTLGGSRFQVVLPTRAPPGVAVAESAGDSRDATAATFAEAGASRQPGPQSARQHALRSNALVLIVEDNRDMQTFLFDMLKERYRVEVASNGKEGLDKALKHLPDVIISDVMMPEMTGDEMVHGLFSHAETKDIPVLMLTAKMDEPLKMSLLKDGVRDYLAKPFSAEELVIKAERLIAERRRIIAERERLIRRLEISNQELERFAFVAAHDLKTPLRSIDNLSQWIEEEVGETLPEDSKQYMAKLRQQVRHMEKMLDDVLEYSHIGATSAPGETEVVDGADIMNSVIALAAAPKDFAIVVSERFDSLRLPRMPLQQIFSNLVQNAIKHHDKSVGNIAVTVADSDTHFVFSVSDDGPGIAPEYHQKIFEMFQTLKPKFMRSGNGMGLALVKKLVVTYGGEVSVESTLGGGSCFRFTWPKDRS